MNADRTSKSIPTPGGTHSEPATSVGRQDAVIMTTSEGLISSWNKETEALFGYRESDILGQPFSLLVPKRHQQEQKLMRAGVATGKVVERYETIMVTASGEEMSVSLSVLPIHNMEGEIVGASNIIRSDQEQTKADIRQAQLAAIVDSSDDAIISKTLDGIITSWNQGAQKIFGFAETEMIGRPITDIIPPDRLDEERLIIAKITSAQRVEHFQTVRLTKNAGRINVSITVSPIRNQHGEIIGASKIARDITRDIELQKQLKDYSEQLKELNLLKDEFIGMASHELKTPLTSIKAYLQLLDRSLGGKDKNKFFVKKTIRHVDKLASLVSDLLDVSKVEAGKLQLQPSEFDIESLVRESIESVQQTTEKHHIRFENNLKQELCIKADEQRIEQVIVNLLTNAIKYSPDASEVVVTLSGDETTVHLSVKDFGIGISKDQKDKIFSRFYRVEGLAPTFSGLGIGLFIARQLVEQHQGRMWVESEPGKGSNFQLTLPVNCG